MEDVASLTIAAVGAAAGLLGLIVAIRANGHAKAANGIAEAAEDEARRANELSSAANDLSRDSNDISIDAKHLAQEANSISRRAQALEVERHDVSWESQWDGPGRWIVTNDSDDDAFRVRAIVIVDEYRAEAQIDHVPGRGTIVLDLPGAATALAEEQSRLNILRTNVDDLFDDSRSRRRRQQRETAETDRHRHVLSVRVSWNSALGKPQHFDSGPYLGRLSGD